MECYDLIGESPQHLEGTLRASLEKAASASPSILLLRNIEALAKKSDAPNVRPTPVVRVLEDALVRLKEAAGESGLPCVLVGTTGDGEGVENGVRACFKQEIELPVSP
jgi:peroxin-6